MKNLILVLNAGSSSLKFKLFTAKLSEIGEGIVEKINIRGSFVNFEIKKQTGQLYVNVKNHEEALDQILDVLKTCGVKFDNIVKIGHRVVHGGEKFVKPTLITKKNLTELRKFNKLAPLHNPNNVAGIVACMNKLPKAKNYIVCDTAYFASLPEHVYHYALPQRIYKKYDVRKFGFHGISHQYVAGVAAKKLKKSKLNLITCHLGSGCSVSAIKGGKAIDTSMGMTPLEGLMMSTRTGDIDAGVVFYLNQQGLSLSRINKLFNQESGLKGVSGLKDMRDIMIAGGYKIPGYRSPQKFTKEQKQLACLALEMFVYRIQKYIGAYTAALGKVDAIVFTAGIGERNKDVRRLVMKGLPFKTKALVIPTSEELQIAKSI